jgi:putative endonuclease
MAALFRTEWNMPKAPTDTNEKVENEKLDPRQTLGREGEDLAAAHLAGEGYALVARNWRPSGGEGRALRGEIDCIAWEGRVLCFIEVKTRSGSSHGAPQEAVNRTKQRQISRLANAYISLHRHDDIPCRFDVIEVHIFQGQSPRLTLHRNAFDYSP